MRKRAKYYTTELCPHCDREVRVPARVKPIPNCPRCRKPCIPCSACDHEKNGCGGCEDGSKFKLHPGEKVKVKSFRLRTLINIADKAYGGKYPMDQNVLHAHMGWQGTGDTLAEFVASELKSVFTPGDPEMDQLQASWLVMERARAQLENVECALKEKWRKLCEKKSRSKDRSR